MPALQVRDFPDDLYEMLKDEARECGRSITQQTKFILLEHFGEKTGKAVEPAAPKGSAEPVGLAERYNRYSSRQDPPERIAARAAQREKLFKRISEMNHHLPSDRTRAADMVREMRDER